MPRGMRREDRRVVAVLGFLHGVVHSNILSIPVFLLAWKVEFGADDVTLGLLAAAGYGFYGVAAVPFGFLADRRAPARLLLVCAAGIAISMAGVAASPSIPLLAVSLGALGLFSGVYHPTGLSIISRVVVEQGRGMGWHGMGGSLGIAAGPAYVGAVLAVGLSWRFAGSSPARTGSSCSSTCSRGSRTKEASRSSPNLDSSGRASLPSPSRSAPWVRSSRERWPTAAKRAASCSRCLPRRVPFSSPWRSCRGGARSSPRRWCSASSSSPSSRFRIRSLRERCRGPCEGWPSASPS